MKLKTLKDLEKECEWKWDTFYKLRQEAIKWIKYHKKLVEHYRNDIEDIERDNWSMTIQECHIDWIKLFFNIKEKDIK